MCKQVCKLSLLCELALTRLCFSLIIGKKTTVCSVVGLSMAFPLVIVRTSCASTDGVTKLNY